MGPAKIMMGCISNRTLGGRSPHQRYESLVEVCCWVGCDLARMVVAEVHHDNSTTRLVESQWEGVAPRAAPGPGNTGGFESGRYVRELAGDIHHAAAAGL